MNREINAELLKRAIIATDEYLGMYKDALKRGTATSQDVHDFTAKLSVSMEALKRFGELENHNIYIEDTIAKMAQLFRDEDISLFDEPFTHVPGASGEAESMEYDGDLIDEDLRNPKDNPCWKGYKPVGVKKKNGKTVPNCVPVKEETDDIDVEDLADNLQWEDICDTYDKEDLEEEVLAEKISAASRLRKRLHFKRTSPKRQLAASIKLKRPSTLEQLQNRARVAARRLLMKKFLHGRDKSKLSTQEKDALEARLSGMRSTQTMLAQRLIPKIRSLESKRLKSKRS